MNALPKDIESLHPSLWRGTQLARAQDSSPAPLRLALRGVAEGVAVELIKRKGPAAPAPIMVKLSPSPNLISEHLRVQRRTVELPTPALEHAAITE